MSRKASDFREYFDAAGRKVAMAKYHLTELSRVLNEHAGSVQPTPPIPIQSHFEGTVMSVIAAIDQIAQGVNSGLSLGSESGDLFDRAFAAIKVVPGVVDWVEKPFGRDLRRIRTRMVHYAYAKRPHPHRASWVVESAYRAYHGSRELLDYAGAAVEHGEELLVLIRHIESQMGRLRSEPSSGPGKD